MTLTHCCCVTHSIKRKEKAVSVVVWSAAALDWILDIQQSKHTAVWILVAVLEMDE